MNSTFAGPNTDAGAGARHPDATNRTRPAAGRNNMGPVMRAAGNGIELVPMNFSLAPSRPRGGPVFNFRSEGRLSTKQSVPHPHKRIFRIHWQETSEGQASLRAERIADHSDCGHLARGQRRSAAGVYDDDDRTRPRCRTVPQPPSRRAPPGGVGASIYLTKPKSEIEILRPLPMGALVVETARQASD